MINYAIVAAICAGKEIMHIYNSSPAGYEVTYKADNTPLTKADKAAHDVVSGHLKVTGFPVLSEEGKPVPYEIRRKWETFWLADPLDGTKEFIRRNGEFTVNIALIHQGKPIAGVVYVPVSQIIFAGATGEGAWKLETHGNQVTFEDLKTEGQKLPCSQLPEVYTVAVSRSHMNRETEAYLADKKATHTNIGTISKGSSLKICLVAEGLAHEYPRFGPTMEWDTAAGHAIVNASGKYLRRTGSSEELTYNKPELVNPWFIAGQ